MLKTRNLNVYYGESHILRDVDIDVAEGSCVCLIGRNGVGKTTLLKTIMGLLPPRSGSIELGGEDVTRLPPHRRARSGIGYVPQGREIIPQLSVKENLYVGLEAARIRSREIPDEVYELFPALYEMLDRKGGDLSGGQQQQLAIARVLVARPRLLILDEPTEGIQPNVIQDIEEVIGKLQSNQKKDLEVVQSELDFIQDVIGKLRDDKSLTILMVEQYLEFAWRLADRYYIMARGSIKDQGDTKDISHEAVHEHLTV